MTDLMQQPRNRSATHLLVAALVVWSTLGLDRPLLAAQPQVTEAAIVAKQAIDYYQNGNPAMAAELYRRAFQLDPTKADYLFGVGRSEQKAGRVREATAAYENVVALLPSTNPLARKAQTALAELRADAAPTQAQNLANRPLVAEKVPEPARAPEPAPATVAPVPAPAHVAPAAQPAAAPAPGDWHRPVGWSLVAVSGAGVVGAVILAVLASKNQSDLNGFKTSAGLYDPTRITPTDVGSRQTSINSLWTGVGIAGGVAAVAGGVGAWALLTAPSPGSPVQSMTLTPGPGDVGLGLAGRF